MAIELKPTGILSTPQWLSVSVQIETPGFTQFGVVKVPTEWVVADPIRESLDRAYRRHLMEVWSGQAIEPLF